MTAARTGEQHLRVCDWKESQWAPVAAALRSPSQSSRLVTNTWSRQTRRRAPGARIGAPEGPARGSGIGLHHFTVRSTPGTVWVAAPEASVAGDTRFRLAKIHLKTRERTKHSGPGHDDFRCNPSGQMAAYDPPGTAQRVDQGQSDPECIGQTTLKMW